MREASRTAVNRTAAGVHFPVDTAAGQVLGLALGRFFIQRATTAGQTFDAWRFDGERYPGTKDFDLRSFCNPANAGELPDPNIDPPKIDSIPSEST